MKIGVEVEEGQKKLKEMGGEEDEGGGGVTQKLRYKEYREESLIKCLINL